MDYKEFKAAVYARLDHATVGVKKIHNGGRRDISDLDDLAIRLSQHVLQLIPAKMAFRNIKDVSIYGLCVEYITDCNRCVNYEPSGYGVSAQRCLKMLVIGIFPVHLSKKEWIRQLRPWIDV